MKLQKIFPKSQVEVYLAKSDGLNINHLTVSNGMGEIVFIDIDDLHIYLGNKNLLGFTIKVRNSNLNDVFKRLEIKKVKNIQGAYYGCSGLFSQQLNLSCKNYNFECVKLNEEIHIGTPILLGSY